MKDTFDWSTFTVRVNINAPINELYRCWATRSGIEYWFLRSSEYKSFEGVIRDPNEEVRKGDSYKWMWHGWPDDTVEYGEILDCNGQDNFGFSFGKAGNCAVKIYDELNETIVELVQKDIPSDEHGRQYWHIGCRTGWTFFLTNMKSLMEGGIDLRNRNVKLQQVLNA